MHIAMSYWNVDGGSGIANWRSRMTAVLFLSFLGGPFLFGAEITKAYLKQVTAMLTGSNIPMEKKPNMAKIKVQNFFSKSAFPPAFTVGTGFPAVDLMATDLVAFVLLLL